MRTFVVGESALRKRGEVPSAGPMTTIYWDLYYFTSTEEPCEPIERWLRLLVQ